MRGLVAAVLSLMPMSALSATIQIPKSYCNDTMRLSASRLEFQDHECMFVKTSSNGSHVWLASTRCKEPDDKLTFLLDANKSAATVFYSDGTSSPPMQACGLK